MLNWTVTEEIGRLSTNKALYVFDSRNEMINTNPLNVNNKSFFF